MTNTDKAHIKGIFIQQVNSGKTSGYCVTFPRLGNLGFSDNDSIRPSQNFKTFSQALAFARAYRESDTRVSRCPIYCLQFSWRMKFYGQRLLQRVQA